MIPEEKRAIYYWLLTGCALIALMVIIGGITRLTHSGLSITEWKLVSGTLPPLSEAQWQESFYKYQQSPEYQKVNVDFTLEDYKSIFWWEYLHRLLGRLIGLVFIIPFIYFLVKKRLNSDLLRKCIVIFSLGALQGFLGWFMVKSGLVDVPRVSHYRLAAHLLTAFISFGYTFYVAQTLRIETPRAIAADVSRYRKLLMITFPVLLLQIIYGAFVAGLRAGSVDNHFPKMTEEHWIDPAAYSRSPFYLNAIESPEGVQFIHRVLAFIVAFLVIALWLRSQRLQVSEQVKKASSFLLLIVFVQVLLGILTLVNGVPVFLGVLHQFAAFILFATAVYLLYASKRAMAV